ncbi:N-acetyl sugar amidotransferase [Treponema pedis]|uniref:N-acetyl sugar amidotransferase n=1 Tax=Treponema pedis TaxID=409322 RepID=A0A7S7AX92_9SPIR|nr:N-acetyl sugar amidotransferase [Treponema pedis]QOW61717.1 N-acetyl sugar amidotransferase [Treponema pedis]
MSEFKRCNRCIMDNISDTNIRFDKDGNCNYCVAAFAGKPYYYLPNDEGKKKLEQLISLLKNEGKNKEYDCLMGISGGLDSSYLAYLGAVKWGLRILAVHVDDGFDTELAKDNIKNLVEKAGITLITITPDEEQFLDLTRAFFYAEVPNLAIPQDNVLFAALYDFARKKKIKYFLSGQNFSLESILQSGNTHSAYDLKHIKAIHKQFGTKPINKLPLISWQRRMIDNRLLHLKTVLPLNYIDYNKEEAIKELQEFSGFTYYEAKHLENVLTKVIQLIWFKEKFKVDKRTSHLSSLIVSEQLTRDKALEIYNRPAYDSIQMEKDISFVLNKLNISRDEFNLILKKPPKQHSDYKTSYFLDLFTNPSKLVLLRKFRRFLRKTFKSR